MNTFSRSDFSSAKRWRCFTYRLLVLAVVASACQQLPPEADPTRVGIDLSKPDRTTTSEALALKPAFGIFRGKDRTFGMRLSLTPGFGELAVSFGEPGDIALAADWDGNGTATVGVYRPADRTFYLKNSNAGGQPDLSVQLGAGVGWPVIGDWDGDGTVTVGLFDRQRAEFVLLNENRSDAVPTSFRFGTPDALPVAGDWDGDGKAPIGAFANGVFALRNSNTPGSPDITLRYGQEGDIPLSVRSKTASDSVAFFRPAVATFFFRDSLAADAGQVVITLGIAGDQPIIGQWSPAGSDGR
jgi:hypothetical protein